MYVDFSYHLALFNIQRIIAIIIITIEIGFIYLFWYILSPIWVDVLIKIMIAILIAIMHCIKKPIPNDEGAPIVGMNSSVMVNSVVGWCINDPLQPTHPPNCGSMNPKLVESVPLLMKNIHFNRKEESFDDEKANEHKKSR